MCQNLEIMQKTGLTLVLLAVCFTSFHRQAKVLNIIEFVQTGKAQS